jgi:hypothetical protein
MPFSPATGYLTYSRKVPATGFEYATSSRPLKDSRKEYETQTSYQGSLFGNDVCF